MDRHVYILMCIEIIDSLINHSILHIHTYSWKKSWNCSYNNKIANKMQLKSHWSFFYLRKESLAANLSFCFALLTFPLHRIYRSIDRNMKIMLRDPESPQRGSLMQYEPFLGTFRGQVAFICILETRGLFCIPTSADKQNSNVWKAKKNTSRRRGFAKVIRWKTRSSSFFFALKYTVFILCTYIY